MTRFLRALAALIALTLAALSPASVAAQSFPPFTGLVVDAADQLPPAVEADLTAKLQALQRDTNRQLVIATIPDLQGYPIADYGYRLGRAWGVGLKDVNNGAILLIAPNAATGQRGPRIEVGYGLEPVLTDALSSVIINTRMMPLLRQNDVPGAMVAGADAMIAQLRASPDEAKARTDAAVAEFDRTQRRAPAGNGGGSGFPMSLIFWLVILAFVVLPMLRGRGRGRAYRGGGGSGLPIVLWSIANEIGRGSGSGGWGGSGGGGSSGGWGGGGFTGGGGGSFGGGGASGSW